MLKQPFKEQREVKLIPNFDKRCDCGNNPCVTVRDARTNALVDDSDMCGVCFFGQEKYIDHEEWL